MSKLHVRTIKLKLRVIDDKKDESWKRLRQISNDAWRAANWIASGQFLNDQMMRRVYARRKIDTKNQDEIQAVEEEFRHFFGTKRQATTERDIKDVFPKIPPCVTNPLNQIVVASYNKEKPDLHLGNRSLRTYRKGMPIQTTKAAVQIHKTDNENHQIKWTLTRQENINFEVMYGRDKANNRLTVERILKGDNDYSAPQIQLKDRDLFLLLPVKEPEFAMDLDPKISVGVDLGISVPAYVGLSVGPARKSIGDVKDFLRVRTQMQARRRQIQRSLKAVSGGNGRGKKLKALRHLRDKETNFVRQYNHFVSREVVNFAVKNKAGTIKMEMLEGFGEHKDHEFFLRNWSYFELQTFINYKAKQAGIKTCKVDPYHTSQTCSICGHYEENQRTEQAFFQCKACSEKLNADYNAAVNIARSTKVVTKKDQCEYFKQRSGQTPEE